MVEVSDTRPQVQAPDGRWWSAAVWVAALAVVGGIGGWVVMHLTGQVWNMIDLSVYQWGGTQVRTGGDLYGGYWPATSISGYHGDNLPFTYTPLAALAFVPVSLLPLVVAQPLLIVLDVVCLGVVIALSLRSLGHEDGRGFRGMVIALAVLGLALEPVTQTVSFGQVNILLMALCLWDLLRPADAPGRGAGIGLAAAIKLTPALFIGFLLLTRQWRAAFVAMATAVAATAVAFVVLPGPSYTYWIDRVFLDASRVGALGYVANQSLRGFVARSLGDGPGATAVWLGLVIAVLAVAALVITTMHRRGWHLAAVLVAALAGLLISPVSWTHHWVWMVPAAAAGVEAARRRAPGAVPALVAGLAVGISAPVLIWRMPQGDDLERHWTPGQAVMGNLYVWAGALALVLCAVAVRRLTPRSPARDPELVET